MNAFYKCIFIKALITVRKHIVVCRTCQAFLQKNIRNSPAAQHS